LFATFWFFFVIFRFFLVAIGLPFAIKRFIKAATRYLLVNPAFCFSGREMLDNAFCFEL
jgi:hypothetical protein